jgi:outer membrane immunogenic protein
MFPSWSVKAEYLYVDLGSTRANSVPLNGGVPALIGLTTPLFAGTQNSPTRFHTVRAGINWHFNPFEAVAPSSTSGALPSVKGPPPAFVDSYQPFQVRLKSPASSFGRPWQGFVAEPDTLYWAHWRGTA